MSLTDRERQVVKLICEGRANKQITFELGISDRTLGEFRQHAMHKLGAKNLAQLGAIAQRVGLLN